MNLIYKIRCAISEPYRIKNGFGLRVIRNKRELDALIGFCRKMSTEYRGAGFTNSGLLKTWDKTIELYDKCEPWCFETHDYIHKHIDEYWS